MQKQKVHDIMGSITGTSHLNIPVFTEETIYKQVVEIFQAEFSLVWAHPSQSLCTVLQYEHIYMITILVTKHHHSELLVEPDSRIFLTTLIAFSLSSSRSMSNVSVLLCFMLLLQNANSSLTISSSSDGLTSTLENYFIMN